ncbi:MAG: gliding motility-associated C-terminal domain-containing protein [Cryomorphaceae bacterium]|nr:gliding motility-associated C-terminal domain-containing protein [Cryomorphaceae bacterium]
MKNVLQSIGLMIAATFPFMLSGQIVSTNAPSQACMGDTITVSVLVGSSNFNVGNTYRVELSDNNNNFDPPANFIEIAPVAGTGSTPIECIVPTGIPQGSYSIRVHSTNPPTIGDTVAGIIIGRLPDLSAGLDIENARFNPILGDWRFCEGDTVILRAPKAPPGETYNYRWYEGGAQIPGQTGSGADTLIVTQQQSYRLRVTLGLCTDFTDSYVFSDYLPDADITPQPGPGILISVDTIRFCEGTVGTLEGPTPPAGSAYTYQWFSDSINLLGQTVLFPLPADTNRILEVDSAMRVYLQVNDSFCTNLSDAFYVKVDTMPMSSVTTAPSTASLSICINDSVFLTAGDTVPGWTYRWQFFTIGNWVDVPNGDQPSLKVDTNLIPDTTDFRLVINNGTCWWTSDTLRVNIVPLPNIRFNISEDTVRLCPGDSILLVAQGNSSSYTWSTGTVGTSIYVNAPGTYSVTGVGANGCSNDTSITVIYFNPNADAGPDQTTNPDSVVQLNGSGGVSYFWYANKPVFFSNQFSSNPFTIASNKPDTVTYYLQIVGANGCTDLDSMQVFVLPLDVPDPEYFEVLDRVPNLITPNGDGYNDALNLSEIMDGDACKLTIMNRWGAEVFTAENYNNNWTGVDNGGTELSDGAYFVILDCDGNVRYKGSVTILRNNQ